MPWVREATHPANATAIQTVTSRQASGRWLIPCATLRAHTHTWWRPFAAGTTLAPRGGAALGAVGLGFLPDSEEDGAVAIALAGDGRAAAAWGRAEATGTVDTDVLAVRW